jgi:hypothetical protein
MTIKCRGAAVNGSGTTVAWPPHYSYSGGQLNIMVGIEERTFQPLPENVSLQELVPKDIYYRRIERMLDLSRW